MKNFRLTIKYNSQTGHNVTKHAIFSTYIIEESSKGKHFRYGSYESLDFPAFFIKLVLKYMHLQRDFSDHVNICHGGINKASPN